MRQFIFAADYLAELVGDTTDYGKLTIVEAATDKTAGENVGLNFVLKRDPAMGGDILYPFYPKDFTYVKATHTPATKFNATLTISEVNPLLDYTLILTKKGCTFNERNNWTVTTHSTKDDTATTVAEKLVKLINLNQPNLGLKATNVAGAITIEAVTAGKDFGVTPADELLGTKVTVATKGAEAFMDAKMIKDLFAKCAADAGFEYTYDDFDGLYPNLDFNPLAQPDNADIGFDVYSIRFTEPRLMGTREEAVYQIIQVAFPKGKGAAFAAALDEYVVDVR